MKQILSIVKYTLRQNIRNRVYYILVVFAIAIIFVTMLLSVLGGEQPVRILLDFGLASIEFFGLLLVIFAGVSLLLEEIESKTVYLMLIRPIPKWYYVIGRYLGLLVSVYLAMLFMYAMHFGMLMLKGWVFDPLYLIAIFSSMTKIAIIGALAVFFSLFSTSQSSSLIFTIFIWILGHFAQELKFLTAKMQFTPIKVVLKVLYLAIPNLQYFNWKDFIGSGLTISYWFGVSVVYAFAYCAVCLLLSIHLFNKKEF
ncbi:MAG: ABC transporter permease subunit [Elusimicrobia bacterium]|nr:ABC transporter permease subunit [Elusimicrobiota bacterium]